jgi:hypothetical protein
MSDLVSYELDGRIATVTMDDGKVNRLLDRDAAGDPCCL